MTRVQLRKLDTILAKLETLQKQVTSAREEERLMAAKNELLRLYDMQEIV